MTTEEIGTLHLYIDANDLNNYIHSHIRPEDREKYGACKFIASHSSVNEKDAGIDITVFAINTEEKENQREMQINMNEIGK